jgi:hypothetical protein
MKNVNYDDLLKKLDSDKSVNLNDINPDQIIDIKDIEISKRRVSNHRMLDFLLSYDNPYVFKVAGKLVKIEFSDNGESAEKCILSMLNNMF